MARKNRGLYYTLCSKPNEFGEFVVKCFNNGKRQPIGDYFTDDYTDAVTTLKVMQEAEEARRAAECCDVCRL